MDDFPLLEQSSPIQTLADMFLTNDTLLRIMTYMCRSGVDPIISTLHTMLTSDVQFTVNKYGLILFRNQPPFPWAYMTWQQREHLYSLIQNAHSKHHPAYACAQPLTFTSENGHIMFQGSVRIPMKLVFEVLLEALERSKRGSRMLCNVLLQKLGAKITIPKEMLLFVHERSKLAY